jgi:hypothetical protein
VTVILNLHFDLYLNLRNHFSVFAGVQEFLKRFQSLFHLQKGDLLYQGKMVFIYLFWSSQVLSTPTLQLEV